MLDITAISKTFHPGTPNARQALRQLSLHLEDGEFATIVGSNGAGKSTLFGAIAGSFYTDEGRILLDGTELTRRIVAEYRSTCLMVTHNMAQSLSLGSRTLMMAEGSIVLDVSGAEREGLTVSDLLERFRSGAGHALDNDRILLA